MPYQQQRVDGGQADRRPTKELTLSQQDRWQGNSANWCISAAGQTDVDGEQMKQLVTRFGQPGAYSTTAAAYHLVIKFCVYLLDVRGQLGKGLCIGQDGTGGVAQETDVPDGG